MRDRYWLERGLSSLLSQRLYCEHQVIWSLVTPADLHWIIFNLKGNSGAHICGQEDTRTEGWKAGTSRLSWAPAKKLNERSLPFMSQRYHQVDSFVCFSFVSRFLLLNFLPNSSFPGMITRPKNVFLQVFNTPSLKRGPSGCFVYALLF